MSICRWLKRPAQAAKIDSIKMRGDGERILVIDDEEDIVGIYGAASAQVRV